MTAPWENMRVHHDDDRVARCLRCRAQAAAARELGFLGYDFAGYRSDYEAILEQIAAEIIVAQRETEEGAHG